MLDDAAFAAAAMAVIVSLGLALYRAIRGPSTFDRLLAGNAIGSLSVLLLSVIGFVVGRPDFLDLAITYAILNMIGTIAVLKFFRYGDLARGGDIGEVEKQ